MSEGDAQAIENVRKNHGHLLTNGRLKLVDGKWCDFFQRGYSQESPYDMVIAGRHYFTANIAEQLKVDGEAYDPWNDNRLK